MNAKVNQFCDGLRNRFHAVEERLAAVKTNMQAVAKEGDKALHEKLDAARRQLQAQKERVEKTQEKLKAGFRQKMTETKEAVNEWKAKREVQKLNVRADRAEAYAADAIDFALATINEAEEAMLDAVVARMDADATK